MKKLSKKQRKKRDSYLRRVYNSSLREYERKDKKQKGRCAICRRPPKNLPLAQDHWHKLAKLKVRATKVGTFWKAFNIAFDLLGYKLREGQLKAYSRNRKKAVKMVRRALMKKSNRGLLCWACNTAIMKFRDNPTIMLAASKYLQKYLRRSNG